MTQAPTAAEVAGKKPEAVMMPVGSRVSWANTRFAMGPQYEKAAERNHRQSLKRLAKRGGLVWSEAAAIVEMRPWFAMTDENAERAVRAILMEQDRHD